MFFSLHIGMFKILNNPTFSSNKFIAILTYSLLEKIKNKLNKEFKIKKALTVTYYIQISENYNLGNKV